MQRLDADAVASPTRIEVLECNWTIVNLFCLCVPDYAGMGQRVGVSAQEVRAAAILCRVPRAEWPDLLAGVRVMDRAIGQ